MKANAASLLTVYDGWQGHHQSIVQTLARLTPEQLAWRPAPHLHSAGELAAHICGGRITWFARLNAPGSDALVAQSAIARPETSAANAIELMKWLDASWQMIERTLAGWTVDDLAQSYPYTFQGKTYSISRQWTIWHILAHDLHHSGEMAITLGMQGVAVPELGDYFGHITLPPLAGTL